MSRLFFSDKENGVKTPNTEDIPTTVFNGIISVFDEFKIAMSSKFSEKCPDNDMIIGFNEYIFKNNLLAYVPTFTLHEYGHIKSLEEGTSFNKYALLDFIEFCWENIKDYSEVGYHSYFCHSHLSFCDGEVNKLKFKEKINRIFERNGIAFKLNDSGAIERILPAELTTIIKNYCHSGSDNDLNLLIDLAIRNITKAKIEDRQIALEKLWDAFERIKTYYVGMDKKASVVALMTTASESSGAFYNLLDKELRDLTDIGNNFRIRHHETNKIEIKSIKHIDYLFYRMMSLISLLTLYI
jgi:hypothetical protein